MARWTSVSGPCNVMVIRGGWREPALFSSFPLPMHSSEGAFDPLLFGGGAGLGRRCDICDQVGLARSYALPGRFPIAGWLWACPECYRSASVPVCGWGLADELDLSDDF